MTGELVQPGLILILGSLLVPLLPGRLRAAWMLLLPVVSFAYMWRLPLGGQAELELLGYTLETVHVDRLSRVFGVVFHLAALLGVLYALHVEDRVQQVAALAYAGSAIGGVFAGDLITLFVFWELAAVTSVFLIWARGSARSAAAGMRYLIVQLASGVILLGGVVVRSAASGSIRFERMELGEAGSGLILLAFAIKAAFPVLHTWLTDTYAEATATGAVFLSAFTTKLAIYALARGFPGTRELVWVGVVMACFPIFYAVIENDLRRVLAYSMVNQLGFMVVGVGLGTELALNGTVAHAFADILFKGLLFMSMGAVLHRVGTTNGSDLGGLYKSMPWTTGFCIVGAASISAFPLFSAFATKSLIMDAVAGEHWQWAWLLLLFASAGVFHHAGIKIPFFAFFAHDSGIRCPEAPLNMRLAMGGAAALSIGIGCFPRLLYELLPFAVDYEPYTTMHVVTQLQLLCFAALAFSTLVRTGIYPPELRSVNLDADWIYRRAAPVVVGAIGRHGGGIRAVAARVGATIRSRLSVRLRRLLSPAGLLGEPWPTGATAFWAALLLAIYLLLFYL